MSNKIIKEYFSAAKQAMIAEAKRHPLLMQELAKYDADDWGGAIGEIAAYCLVSMEGSYMPSEMERLYDIVTFKMKAKRSAVIDLIDRSKN